MIPKIKNKAKKILAWSQKYTQADMLYVASSGFWTTISSAASSIFSISLVLVIANYLPKETYGAYKYIMSLSGALAFLTFSGMNTAVTQAVANGHDGVLNYALKFQLKWNFIFFAGSSLVATYYFLQENMTVAVPLIILGLVFPLISAFNTFGSFLIGKKDFKRLALWGIAVSAIYNLAMIGAILIFEDTIFLVLAYSAGHLLPIIYFYFRTVQLYKPPRQDLEEEKKLVKYGAHLSFMNIFSNLSQYVDKITVFHFLGPVELATYGLALAIPERIKGYSKAYSAIILPRLSSKDMKDIKPVFYKRTFQGIVIGAFISLAYITIAPILFRLFLPKYLESVHYSQILSLSLIITVPASYMAGVFYSQKMLKTIYLSSTTAHVTRIILFILFGYLWGVWGVIYASLLVYVLGFFYNIILWELEVKKYDKSLLFVDINKQTLRE